MYSVLDQNTVEVTNADGCVGTDTVLVSVFEPVFKVQEDETICFGDTTELDASGVSTYTWSLNTISDVNASNPEVLPSTTTTYVVNAVDATVANFKSLLQLLFSRYPLQTLGKTLQFVMEALFNF